MNTGEQSHQQEALLDNIPENPYEVSPGMPDLIPLEWREILQEEGVCVNGDETAVRRAGLRFYVKYKDKRVSSILFSNNDLDRRNAQINLSMLVADLIKLWIYKTSRIIDWINLYATARGISYWERIKNLTTTDGKTVPYGINQEKFFQDNTQAFEHIGKCYLKYSEWNNEADLLETSNAILSILQTYINQFGFNAIEVFAIKGREILNHSVFLPEIINKICNWYLSAQESSMLVALGVDNFFHFSQQNNAKPSSFPRLLSRLFGIEWLTRQEFRKNLACDMVLLKNNPPEHTLEWIKKISKAINLNTMEEWMQYHTIPWEHGTVISNYSELSKMIFVEFDVQEWKSWVIFCYDGENFYQRITLNAELDVSYYVPLHSSGPNFPNFAAYHNYIEAMVVLCSFDRMSRTIEAKTKGTESKTTDSGLDISILMDIWEKIIQNPGDLEIFMSLLLSRMNPVSVDVHRHGRGRQVMQITEKSGFYHRPPAIFIRQAIGFPVQEQRALAQKYWQKLHAYIGKVDTKTKEAYERMESVKTAFDTEALQKLPLGERLEKIRELYSTNPDHISSKSITDIAKTRQRWGFEPLKYDWELIWKFSFERLTDDGPLIDFLYKRAPTLISEIESDILQVSQDTMSSLTPEELVEYDKIWNSLSQLHVHFTSIVLSNEGKKQSILVLQNALTRLNGELSREFLAKLTGFVYLFECENIRKNIDTVDSEN